jgi:rod shape-determining protein MreC
MFFSALSIALVATDARLHYLDEVRQGFIALTHPLQTIANAPSALLAKSAAYITTHTALVNTNLLLMQQAMSHAKDLQKLRLLESENRHLRDLLGASQSITEPARLGEILHAGRDPFSHKIMVNIGARQNIMPGQVVVDGKGVIGQVTRIYPFSSEVTLITDKELSVPVQIERNGLRAIAFGIGIDNSIDLPYLPVNVDIEIGDRLITSGIDGIYPAGLAVAEVISIDRHPEQSFAQIRAKPVAGVKNHRQVLLISIPVTGAAIGHIVNNTAKYADKTLKLQPALPKIPVQPAPSTPHANRQP